MKFENHKKFLASGVIGLLLPIYYLVLWIYVVQTNKGDQSELVIHFHRFFPTFLQKSNFLTLITL